MNMLEETARAVADLMKMDAGEAGRRKAFLEFGERDAELLRELHERLGSARLGFVESFYEHLLLFEETRKLIEDPETLRRVKGTQAAYFERLTAGTYDWDYVTDRLRVGAAHQRVGLDPQWYIGAYRKYLAWLLPAIWRLYPHEPDRAFDTYQALMKVVFFDMGLAIDAYLHADRSALLTTKAYAEKVVASVPSGLLVLRNDLVVSLANHSFGKMFGVRADDLAGRKLAEVLPAAGLGEHALEVMATGETRYQLPFEVRTLNGEARRLRITLAGIRRAAEEEEEEVLLVVEDLSEEERLRAEARASEIRFREVVEHATDGIVMMGEDRLISYFNGAAERMFGYCRDEVLGRPVTMLMPQQYREQHEAGMRRFLATGRSTVLGTVHELEGQRKDGTVFPLELTISACRIDGYIVFTAVLRDISARRAAEERLRLLAAALEAVGDPVTITDRDGIIRYTNRAFTAQNGYLPEEVAGKRPSLLKSGLTDPARYRDLWDTILAGRVWSGEVTNRRKNGSTYIAELSVAPVRNESGEITHFVGTHRDITARRYVEEALRRSEESFRTLIERSPDAIAALRHGRFVYVNPALQQFLGYETPDDIIGRPVNDIVHPEDREAVAERIQTMLQTGAMAPARERRFLRKDGATVFAEVVAMPLVFGGEPAIVAVARDVTERRQLATRMMQMDRMIAVGTLAAGVAHEINTPVQFVSDSVHFLREAAKDVFALLEKLQGLQRLILDGADPSVLREAAAAAAAAAEAMDLSYIYENVPKAFERSLDGLERVAKIVRSMKEFAHPGSKEMSSVDLKRSILSTLTVARNEYKYVADVETELGEIPDVMGHEADLNQVFLNVIVNAAQAIADVVKDSGAKGRITIRTWREGDDAVIAIADTGKGIPGEIRDRIFDPFFTTKEVGRGTGQGLAIARSVVVDRHGGSLTFESEVGKGTTFYIRLPIQGRRGGAA